MLPELTQEEFSAALDAVAASLVDVLALHGPPVDAVALASALGLAVALDSDQRGRGRTVRLSRFGSGSAQGSILLRPEPRPERRQWAVAHEIGETCAFQVFDRLAVDPREAAPGAREAVANQLAGRLLLPRDWFERDGQRLRWELPGLKARYSTASHELIARRMLDFGPPIAITVFDHGELTWRQTNVPGRVPPINATESAAWRIAHERSQAAAAETAQFTVQAWPVHEANWKREIVRVEWQDCQAGEAFE
jgi:IrrE N-terminal-like domain